MSYVDLVFCCWLAFLNFSHPPPETRARLFKATREWYGKMMDMVWVCAILGRYGVRPARTRRALPNRSNGREE
ncbi:hypothetical protein F5B21DRAFT_457173 [Xylaria acuta]|nr:hypothetical protein F5B21DRAFT_457173 [Xylaria acuta]